jgi:hypothetical protein
MSALCHNQTYAPQQKAPLFDYLVGAREQRWRHGQAERLGSLEIDRQIDLGRPLDREVSRFRALDNLVGESGSSPRAVCWASRRSSIIRAKIMMSRAARRTAFRSGLRAGAIIQRGSNMGCPGAILMRINSHGSDFLLPGVNLRTFFPRCSEPAIESHFLRKFARKFNPGLHLIIVV